MTTEQLFENYRQLQKDNEWANERIKALEMQLWEYQQREKNLTKRMIKEDREKNRVYCNLSENATNILHEAERQISLNMNKSIQLKPTEILEVRGLKPNTIIKVFCEVWGVDFDYFMRYRATRKPEIISIKHQVSGFMWPATTLQKIAETFGQKDHSTILNAIRKHNNYMDVEPGWRNKFYIAVARLKHEAEQRNKLQLSI